MQIWPYDYANDGPTSGQGIAQAALLIRRLRAESTNCLLFDNGDYLQGTPMGDMAAAGGLATTLHPMVAAMNALGYDAVTVGNHEFNYGLDFAMNALKGFACPVVLSNLARTQGPTPDKDDWLFAPYTVLTRRVVGNDGTAHALRIGVIGFTPPQVMVWDHKALHGRAVARDIVETAQALVPRLRAEGADLVIALCHSGIGASEPYAGMENAARALAQVAGIDAILAGHEHRIFPDDGYAGLPGVDLDNGTLFGVPTVMAGFWGQRVGQIDLTLQKDGAAWQVVASQSRVRRIGDASGTMPEADTAVLDATRADHDRTLALIRRPVGHTSVPLQSYFACVAPSPALDIVAEAQRWFAQNALDGTPLAHLPLLSAVAPFKAGGRGGADHYVDIGAGALSLRHAADLYLFANHLQVLRLTGKELGNWLERIAGQYLQVAPGVQDAPLLDPAFPPHQFDLPQGAQFEIDLSQPARFDVEGFVRNAAAQRIRALRIDGVPVADSDSLLIVTNDYRASGGGHFAGCSPERVVFETAKSTRDVLVDFLKTTGAFQHAPRAGWGFTPMPGTTAVFDSAPAAARHVDTVAGRRIEGLGASDNGFDRFRLHL